MKLTHIIAAGLLVAGVSTGAAAQGMGATVNTTTTVEHPMAHADDGMEHRMEHRADRVEHRMEQRREVRHDWRDDHDNGHHYGWRNHRRCWTQWRHHQRVRICR